MLGGVNLPPVIRGSCYFAVWPARPTPVVESDAHLRRLSSYGSDLPANVRVHLVEIDELHFALADILQPPPELGGPCGRELRGVVGRVVIEAEQELVSQAGALVSR